MFVKATTIEDVEMIFLFNDKVTIYKLPSSEYATVNFTDGNLLLIKTTISEIEQQLMRQSK